jgi:hypothetical protein
LRRALIVVAEHEASACFSYEPPKTILATSLSKTTRSGIRGLNGTRCPRHITGHL